MLSVDFGSMKLARIVAGVAPNGLCGALLFGITRTLPAFNCRVNSPVAAPPPARPGGSHLQYRYTSVYYLQYRYTSVYYSGQRSPATPQRREVDHDVRT